MLLMIFMSTVFMLSVRYIATPVKSDFYSPLKLSVFILIITNIPYLISLSFDYELLHINLHRLIPQSALPIVVSKYLLLLSISVLFLALGIKSKTSNRIGFWLPTVAKGETPEKLYGASLCLIFIGLSGYFIFFQRAGGFLNWINNLKYRASFTSGNGYLLSLMGLLPTGIYMYVATFKYKNNRLKRLTLLLLILFVVLLLSTLGGRKSVLFFLINIGLVWRFMVGKIKRIPLKIMVLSPIILFYILLVPILRSSEDMSYYFNEPSILVDEVKEDTAKLSKQISYVDHYLLIMEKFEFNDLWWGKSYIDLVYAPIPSSIYIDKPPVDDGMYVRTMAEGVIVEPNTSRKQLYQSSWPPETFGAGYMNFSWIGVIIGMYILGVIYNISYVYMVNSNYTLMSILIYGEIMLNFQLSNLRIAQTSFKVLLLLIVFSFFFISKKKRRVHKLKVLNNKKSIM